MAPVPRRQRMSSPIALIALITLVFTGCGANDSSDEPSPSTGTEGFPVTIEHAHGSVTIESAPERVVALGSADVQIARGLGAEIVGAVRSDYAPDGQWLGIDPKLGESTTMLSATEPNLEQIATLEPDLILITTAQPSYGDVYDKLTEIAPVVSYQKGLLEDSGTNLVRLIGTALGRADRADELITTSDELIAEYAASHPKLAGSTITFGQYVGGETYLVVSPTAPSTAFFAGLDISLPEDLAAIPVQAPPGIAVVSAEELDLLDDADQVILGVGSEQDQQDFLSGPVVSNLEVTQENKITFLDFNQASLLLTPNPASTPAMLGLLDSALVSP